MNLSTNLVYRHKKRGGLYKIICRGTLQIEGSADNTEVLIYGDWPKFEKTYVRPVSEFIDGRFEVVV